MLQAMLFHDVSVLRDSRIQKTCDDAFTARLNATYAALAEERAFAHEQACRWAEYKVLWGLDGE